MGCGASAVAKVVDAIEDVAEAPLNPDLKPVTGTITGNSVQGSPILSEPAPAPVEPAPVGYGASTGAKVGGTIPGTHVQGSPLLSKSEGSRKSCIVMGLANSAIAAAEEKPLIAAGLATAAAGLAEAIVGNIQATGLAATASAAAEARAETAPGLIKAAAESAVTAVLEHYQQNAKTN
jgi:hypothetical protein